jgi:hypothetical protein
MKDPKILERAIIRIGVRSSPQEKERMRAGIKRALGIVVADPSLAETYARADVVEHIVVPTLLQALRDLKNLSPQDFAALDPEREAGHGDGDAYTVAIEHRGPQGQLLSSKNYMLLREELLRPENFAQFLITLDHECRHMKFLGMGLARSEEERRVYTEGIRRMKRVAQALQSRGGDDAVLGRKMIEEAIPVHERRLLTWQR